MRAVLVVTLLLVAGAQANWLSDLGDAFKTTFHQVVDSGKDVGSQLLDQVKVTGAQLASQGLQALMLNVADALTSTDAPATDAPATDASAKRQLSSNEDELLYAHSDELKQLMQQVMNSTQHMDHPENYQPTIQDFLDRIDQVVANHEAPTGTPPPDFRKREVSLEQLLAPFQSVDGLVQVHANELKAYMQTAFATLTGLAEQLTQPTNDILSLQDLIAQVDRVVADHNASADSVVQKLVQEVTSLVPGGQKRSLTDSLAAVGKGLSQVFQPHVELIKSLVASVGEVLKRGAAQMMSSLASSVLNMATQLQNTPHVDTVKAETSFVAQAGQDAVTSLKETVADVIKQTLTNMKPDLANVASHLLSAAVGN